MDKQDKTPERQGCGIGSIAIFASIVIALSRAAGMITCRSICILIPLIAYGIMLVAAFVISFGITLTQAIINRRKK